MISIFPRLEETRLVSLQEEELLDNFENLIKPVKQVEEGKSSKEYAFNGTWNRDGFSISLILKISNNFIPIVNGKLLPSEEGILVKMDYELFPSTKRLLLFWTIIGILLTLFFAVFYQAWLYAAICFGFCVVNYVLSRENFKIQTRKTKRQVERLFTSKD